MEESQREKAMLLIRYQLKDRQRKYWQGGFVSVGSTNLVLVDGGGCQGM